MPLKLNSEVFLIPDGETYLVYAPQRHCVMRLQPEYVNLLVRFKKGRFRKGEADTDFVKTLQKEGLVNGKTENILPTSVGKSYIPTRMTLLLTSRCNLACVYCYAGNQTKEYVMPEELGKAAINYIATNCTRKGTKFLELGFHGGGEPTMAWETLTTLTRYARSVCEKKGLELRSGIATNGYLSPQKARWIASNFSSVNISLDGPPRIHDRLRLTKKGSRTSSTIRRTLRILEASGTPYGIQSTITKATVHRMPSIVRYISRYTKPTLLKFEPVSDCGRYSTHSDQIPDGKQFAHYFNQAYEVGIERKLHVAFSGIRLNGPGLSYFCGAFGEPFAVTPDGYVSACYEAYSAKAPYADAFIFGRYDQKEKRFMINKKKLERLRKRNIYTISSCKKCFCRYSCAGDCATRTFRHFGNTRLDLAGARCQAIREITRYQLARMVDNTSFKFVERKDVNVKNKRQQKKD